MTDALISEIIKYIRSHTAMRAWFAEFLTVFVLFTTGRFALAVWMRMDAYPGKPGWQAWLYAYDNLRHYADDALIAAFVFTIIFEGGFMFLARKRIALSREEGREEGRAEAQAESAAQIRQMQQRIRELEARNGSDPNN